MQYLPFHSPHSSCSLVGFRQFDRSNKNTESLRQGKGIQTERKMDRRRSCPSVAAFKPIFIKWLWCFISLFQEVLNRKGGINHLVKISTVLHNQDLSQFCYGKFITIIFLSSSLLYLLPLPLGKINLDFKPAQSQIYTEISTKYCLKSSTAHRHIQLPSLASSESSW